ncbi:MAG: tetratricopeptide repeat protein [Rhodospirillaceae bacterium]|jgi:tetratricopeptide (TPR) repeat protein|nr:tetratricopeptide repeat protein [Rhodospirillaceae bacterium]MBT3491424.1 tetratricopeptide repeat protein [Rhodospirillaceae bacterium]MBT3782572.1 tetratricopeptide repeat protein [Rhodospirillaceae bacterium]MBT3974955.1 tetratricopeptide repeat protein [Rhodospirillaceae bacterium]MBT4171088.1 tetratricopeptide repeat protein [Rhodospirillaceae bacterium]
MKLAISCLLAMLLLSGGASAAGSNEDKTTDSPWAPTARKAISDKDWTAAIKLFERDVAAKTATADTYNYLGFAYRGLKQYDKAFEHYAIALKMNPEHRGAHEYLGETYLAVGNLAKAKEHLAALDRICFFGCQEYDDLKAAVAAYRPK